MRWLLREQLVAKVAGKPLYPAVPTRFGAVRTKLGRETHERLALPPPLVLHLLLLLLPLWVHGQAVIRQLEHATDHSQEEKRATHRPKPVTRQLLRHEPQVLPSERQDRTKKKMRGTS